MTYRSLLVLLDADPSCAQRVRTAIELAARMDAHLVGLAPTGAIDLPSALGAAASLAELAALAWDRLRDEAEQAAEEFRKRCRAAGLKSSEAVVDRADAASSVVRHSHCSDLTLLSQADPLAAGRRQARSIIEDVVLGSARPSLVLPHAGRFESVGTRVLVAWDGSREAARAMWDALPLLRLAEQVQVVQWQESDAGINDDEARRRLDAVHGWLMWQGVASAVRVERAGTPIAQAIGACAQALEADLIVMGAYGHARWTERLLGGATRGLLEAAAVPLLMVH